MSIKIGNRTFSDANQLEKLVRYAATQYEKTGYAEDFDQVEVTDPEYDALYRELKKLKPDSKAFEGTSPSEAKPKGALVKHDPPMTSINKADGTQAEKEEILSHWIADCAKRLSIAEKDLKIAQSYKRDGVALRINYVKGKLVSAGLRPRDGVNGSDVTRHMKYITGVPQKLALPLTLSLNGEIECWNDDFAEVNKAMDALGEDQYKNPRNYTAGCMGRDDPEENKDSRLRIAFYSITGFADWKKYYTTEIERAKWANSKTGLNLQDEHGRGYYIRVLDYKFAYLAELEKNAKNLKYYTDGVVLKVSSLEDQEELGHTGDDDVNPPRGALAWKFIEETADAEVSSIEWNASRTGRIVPTAIFNVPFVLADTENTRATCNNYGWMESQNLGPGAKVLCKKGGKIIPNIMKVLQGVPDIGAPKNCPACNCKLTIEVSQSGNKDLICENDDCGAKHIKGWLFYVQKLGGKGMGLSAMEKVLLTGQVKILADLYDLKLDDLTKVGFSERQAALALATIYMVSPDKDTAKLLKAVEDARTKKHAVEAWRFFAALGISGAGETAGKALFKHFGDFDRIRAATKDELLEVAGIGDTTAEAISTWFQETSASDVDKLLLHVQLELPKAGKLSGKNFCLTGAFSEGKKHWQGLIEAEGGNVQNSFSSSTNYLVQEHGKNDGSLSDKEKKAAKIGVPVISISDLKKLL